MTSRTKVFGVGFHKTSTTSLANALYTLGYSVTGHFGQHDPRIAQTVRQTAFRLADRFDAAQDTPWPLLYRDLDERYPGSKFVLTVRDPDRWVTSVVKHFKDREIHAQQWIYGVRSAAGNEDVYIERYERHNREVVEYFADRPGDLLIMDITRGDGWDKLCPFLGLEIPPVPFPTQNRSQDRRAAAMRRAARSLRRRARTWSTRVKRGGSMQKGVSAAFVRDLVHYHYVGYEPLLRVVGQLPPEQLWWSSDGQPSIGQLLADQVDEEREWRFRLEGERRADVDTSAVTVPVCERVPHALVKLCADNRVRMRRLVADLTDEATAESVADDALTVWEVIVHVVTRGVERRTRIADRLATLGVPVERPSFIDVFHTMR